MFYFGYYIYQLAGIVYLSLFKFRNFFNILSFSVIKFAGFCLMPFRFTIMSYWFSGWAFVVWILVCYNAVSTISFLWSFFLVLFRIFLCVLLCGYVFLWFRFLGWIIEDNFMRYSVCSFLFFLFVLSVVQWYSICFFCRMYGVVFVRLLSVHLNLCVSAVCPVVFCRRVMLYFW